MKKICLKLVVICFVSVCSFRCATTKSSPSEFITLPDLVFPKIMYYGANLGYFPPEARDFIMHEQFTKEKMEKPFMINPSLKVWWGEDNNTILMEVSYTVAKGYVGAGTVKTWEGPKYSGSSDIFRTYGKYAHYQTLRFKYEYSLYAQNLLRTDPAFAEIIAFAKKLCAEIEYDWANFSAYRGSPVKPTPGLRRAVCEGYANEVIEKALKLPSVKAVQRWTGPNHAWTVLKLVDGRTLYFDLTWFDNEHINEKTGKIYQTDDYHWENITFYEHLFRFSNVGYGSGEFTHNLGRFDTEIRK